MTKTKRNSAIPPLQFKACSPKKKLVLERLPSFYMQRKNDAVLQARAMRFNSKAIKNVCDGKEAEVSPPEQNPKFRAKPFTVKQKAAQKRTAIACRVLEAKQEQHRKEAREQMQKKAMEARGGFINKLGVCKTCGHLMHRMTKHTEYDCETNIMRRKNDFCR
jgi:hypothetical protein